MQHYEVPCTDVAYRATSARKVQRTASWKPRGRYVPTHAVQISRYSRSVRCYAICGTARACAMCLYAWCAERKVAKLARY
eukprot:384881-Rhodomonas_salina.2